MTRFGLLLPHFGVDADQDLLIEGVQLAERLGLRLHLGARPPGLPPARDGRHGPDVHRAVRDAVLPGRARRSRIGLGAATIIPFRHPITVAYSIASMSWLTPPPVRPGRRVRATSSTSSTSSAGRNAATGADARAGADRASPVDRRVRGAPQRPVRLRRRRSQAPVRSTTSRVWWGGATPASARLARGLLPGLAARPASRSRPTSCASARSAR